MTEKHSDENKTLRGLRLPTDRGGFLLVASIVMAALLVAGVLFLLLSPASQQKQIADSAPQTRQTNRTDEHKAQYEEFRSLEFAKALRKADAALHKALEQSGTSADHVKFIEVHQIHKGDVDFLHQTIEINLATPKDTFTRQLTSTLLASANQTAIRQTSNATLVLSTQGHDTHLLILTRGRDSLVEKEPLAIRGNLVVVIDDMGEDIEAARQLSALPVPITFAIWPFGSKHKEVEDIARQSQLDVIVHQPMEPQSYPEATPGPGALFANMTNETIQTQIAQSLLQVPSAIGMNNHMGSRFTEMEDGMGAVMEELKRHSVFFLDSRTTAKSVARKAASNSNLPFYTRNVFLDNVRDVDAILAQLKKTEQLALTKGQAIAIGHPYPETVQALQTWAQTLPDSIHPVRLSSLPPQ